MTKIYVWSPGLSLEEQKNGAYWERNMLALRFADGWYYDHANDWEGWKRVLSLDGGAMNFHIPDDFPVGDLMEIEPSYDGHSTEEKWQGVLEMRGIK